jgi:formylglycine-generating enzyme required for sulfatase activity
VRDFFVAVIAIGVLSGALFGLGQISEQNLLTGNFYKMDNTSDLEKEYNSIDWNKTSEKDEHAGSVYSGSFDNLNITKVSIDNRTANISSEEALKLSNPGNSSINIKFSDSILGITGKNISLKKTSDLKLRLRDNITLEIKSMNKTYSKYIRTLIPDRKSSENQTTRIETRNETQNESTEYQGENETTPIKLNLTNNMSKNITSPNSLKLINNRNHTVKLVSNNSEIIYKTEAKIRGNHSLTLNNTDERNIKIKSQNKTRYDISYNTTRNLSDGAKPDNSSIKDSRDTENRTERTVSSDQNATEINETQRNRSNASEGTGKEINSTENRTLEAEGPERGGKWVKINSERLKDFYILKYEASRKDANSTSEGKSSIPYSQRGVRPWNQVSQKDALTACKSLGKNYSLPSNKQWQVAALSGNKNQRNLGGKTESSSDSCRSFSDGGSNDLCRSGTGPKKWTNSAGAVDMVGNLWEWTDTVYDLPIEEIDRRSGYITAWDGKDSLPEDLSYEESESSGNSYFYASPNGRKAVRKGGGVGMGDRSGRYSTLIDRSPEYESSSIGFRCVYNP